MTTAKPHGTNSPSLACGVGAACLYGIAAQADRTPGALRRAGARMG